MPIESAGESSGGELGALLRHHREARGLSQDELATLVEATVSRNTISNVERGRTRPYRHTLDLLAAALGLDANQRAELTVAWRALGSESADGKAEPASPWSPVTAVDAAAAGSLQNLGERRLADPVRPAHVFQLVHHESLADCLPLGSRDIRPQNLPPPSTPLIGRGQELVAIAARLQSAEVRLLTLTGAGGIGKTRLALQAAASLLDEYADGVFFVALASIANPSLVLAGIAQALGVPDAGGDLRNTLRDFLREKQLLLVLDNFEHLMDAASLVQVLLTEAPGLNVMVTSREVLRVSGEHVFPVPPLGLPPRAALPSIEQLTQYEAVRLFIARAQAVKPDFQVTNANAPAVAEICQHLDGLPLAIELAAARVRHLPPEALLPRLERRFSVLTGGARDLPARQQTLSGALAWSYDLLTVEEQALFRRLAVFAGGCTLEGVEAVCVFDSTPAAGHSIDVLDSVASLVDKSLVRQAGSGGEPRYTMLETVREYGLEELSAAGEELATRARHAEYYEALAQRAAPHFLGAEQLTWLARMDDELDNVRIVLQWLLDHDQRERGQFLAGSLWYFWGIHCRVTEGREWLTRLLAGRDGSVTSAQARGRVLVALALIAQKQSDMAACQSAVTESLALERRGGDAWSTAMQLTRSGWLSQRLADWSISPQRELAGTVDSARRGPAEDYEEALALFRRLGDDWGTAHCLGFYAQFLVPRDAARARKLAAEAVEIARRLGERYALALALAVLARLAITAGELSEARRQVEQSLILYGEIKALYDSSGLLGLLAQLEIDKTRFADAQALYERCVANYRLLGNRPRLAHTLHDLGIAARMAEDVNRALQAYEESLALFQDLGQPGEVAAVMASLGHLHQQRGAFAQATQTFAESVRLLSSQDIELGIATVLAGLGRLALGSQRPADAARLLGAAEALLERLQSGPNAVHLNPSTLGWSLRGLQFRRDTAHVRELRATGLAAFEAMGPEAFETALDAGRVMSTAEAVALSLEQAERSIDDIHTAVPTRNGGNSAAPG